MSYDAIPHILNHCGSLKTGEKLLILCDDTTEEIASLFDKKAKESTSYVALTRVLGLDKHGQEPPADVAEEMLQADLIISLCRFSLAHSMARVMASEQGARFLSMPLYTLELLDSPALTVDYKAQSQKVRAVADLFTNGNKVCVTTSNGTNISLEIDGRSGNYCPGFVEKAGDLGSPPDIEANVSPVESGSNGVVCVDGSITCPELGLLEEPVFLTVENGLIVKIESDNKSYVEILENILGPLGSKRRVLAECGVGLNPMATLTGTMLTDEGALGCVHFGFGSNYTVGGKNKVDFHLDFVFKNASLKVGDVAILEEGTLLL